MPDEWFIAISRSSLLYGTFAIKNWVVFSLISLGTLKHDCVIKTGEIFNVLPLIKNSVTIEFGFSYESYQQSYHQKTLFYFLYRDCIHQYFDKHHAYHSNTQ